ncbi:MBL fold metallo-hydrolase [Methylobacterium brachythecii]|uniref:Glyoxylase-like metal-dependent hydrolase (Beta-lactamase superfamily II) n=1 Tax=Methylobacterium brachythecii TaxID=1176177 RepID=A0A7W6AIY1_9HYPH|nr:MBL fold metallo-hydrolase [Methylobacterium brachythecii]MBB3901756.1 glyoxylase-like metal-dependent hydrolase (beta-lactamase superfamily II) [Methylobacterium brachythecii]GLS43887.1 MBL fold metallo-hydrolase [Methylobacterium brachythecii]
MITSTRAVTRRRLMSSAAAMAAGSALAASTPSGGAASPHHGPTRASFHRIEIGAFEVTMLLDATAMIDGPWPIVGEDRPRGEIEALMRENRLPPTRFQPGFTPVLVNTGRQTVLFDTGNGGVGFVPRPAGGRLGERLAAAGVDPAAIDLVVLTHCHTDHIGGLAEGGRPFFPNAAYAVCAREFDFWSKPERLSAEPDGNEYKSALVFGEAFRPLAERTRFLKPGDEVCPGIHALAAFGHTPGHLAYHVESEGRRLLIWGDCAHHEVASLAHPEWSAFFDMDKAQGAATRRAIYEMAATEEIVVAGYHTSFPSLGYVARNGTGYRWVPVSYQLDL